MTEDDKSGRRFSDPKLHDFYEDFKSHEANELKTADQLLDCQGDLKHAIDALAASAKNNSDKLIVLANSVSEDRKVMTDLAIETKELISTWHDAKGAVKVLSMLGGFLKWVGGLTIIYFAVIEAIKHADKVK